MCFFCLFTLTVLISTNYYTFDQFDARTEIVPFYFPPQDQPSLIFFHTIQLKSIESRLTLSIDRSSS